MLHFPVLVSLSFALNMVYRRERISLPMLVHAGAGTLHAERRHAHTLQRISVVLESSVLRMQSGRLHTYRCTPHSDTDYKLIIAYTTRKNRTPLCSNKVALLHVGIIKMADNQLVTLHFS